MGQIVIQYPNAKAQRIYTALVDHFNIPLTIWDPAIGDNRPKTLAELKADTDAAIRDWLKQRVKMIERRNLIQQTEADQDATFDDPNFTEGP